MEPKVINFTKKRTDISYVFLRRSLGNAILKHCKKSALPASEEKNVMIYTDDSSEIFHGNGIDNPLSVIVSNAPVSRVLVFAIEPGAVAGPYPMQLYVPFGGEITEVVAITNTPLIKELSFEIEKQEPGKEIWTKTIPITCTIKEKEDMCIIAPKDDLIFGTIGWMICPKTRFRINLLDKIELTDGMLTIHITIKI